MRNCFPEYEFKIGKNQKELPYVLGINKFLYFSKEKIEENFYKILVNENNYSYKYFYKFNSDTNKILTQNLLTKFAIMLFIYYRKLKSSNQIKNK
jgi:hypothetical protein